MALKMYILLLVALIPVVMGAIWYSKPLFGSAWLKIYWKDRGRYERCQYA